MARNIGVSLGDPKPVYRAVILKLYPGIHNRTLKTYTTADGTEYLYHDSDAYGPYENRAPATSKVTQSLRQHADRIRSDRYTHKHTWNGAKGSYDMIPTGDSVPEVKAFIEEQVPSWNPVPGTLREA